MRFFGHWAPLYISRVVQSNLRHRRSQAVPHSTEPAATQRVCDRPAGPVMLNRSRDQNRLTPDGRRVPLARNSHAPPPNNPLQKPL